MKVVVPFTRVVREQVRALLIDEVDPLYVYMEEESSYWKLLHGLWEEQETFIVIEHDVIPWPGAIKQLWECSSPWCTYKYCLEGFDITAGFGCTVFRDVFIAAIPDAWESSPKRHWWGLDCWLADYVQSLMGYSKPHMHEPPVTHLNPWRFPLDPSIWHAARLPK